MISVEFTNSDLSGVGKNYQSTQHFILLCALNIWYSEVVEH